MFAAENGLKGDPRLEAISAAIRVVPNFPKKGLTKHFFISFVSLVFCLNKFHVLSDRDYVSGHNYAVT